MPSNDDRAVTPVLGFILVVGILVIAVSVWQVQVVPFENSAVEHEHYQRVTSDLIDLRNELLAVGSRGTVAGVTVQTGMAYPDRTILINPGPVAGELETGPARSVWFENIRAVDTEAANTRSYWADSRAFVDVSRGIVYHPGYNYNTEAELPPVVVTGEAVFGATDSSVVSFSDQTLIDGNRIRLTFITGNVSNSARSTSVITEPYSTSVRTVTVTGNGSDPVTLRLDAPPQTTADDWVGAYGVELEATNSRVVDVRSDSGEIVVELDESETYQVQLASVKVRNQGSGPTALDPRYIIAHSGDGVSVESGQTASLLAEVRDEYNNPVRSANVTFSITNGDASLLNATGTVVPGDRTISTDADGRAHQPVKVTSPGTDVQVEASIDGVTGPLGSTVFTVQTPPGLNPDVLSGVRFVNASSPQNQDYLTFENVGSEDRVIEQFRVNFYSVSSVATGDIEGNSFTVGGSSIPVSLAVDAGSTETFEINFDSGGGGGGGSTRWMVMTVTYDTGDTGQYVAIF